MLSSDRSGPPPHRRTCRQASCRHPSCRCSSCRCSSWQRRARPRASITVAALAWLLLAAAGCGPTDEPAGDDADASDAEVADPDGDPDPADPADADPTDADPTDPELDGDGDAADDPDHGDDRDDVEDTEVDVDGAPERDEDPLALPRSDLQDPSGPADADDAVALREPRVWNQPGLELGVEAVRLLPADVLDPSVLDDLDVPSSDATVVVLYVEVMNLADRDLRWHPGGAGSQVDVDGVMGEPLRAEPLLPRDDAEPRAGDALPAGERVEHALPYLVAVDLAAARASGELTWTPAPTSDGQGPDPDVPAITLEHAG